MRAHLQSVKNSFDGRPPGPQRPGGPPPAQGSAPNRTSNSSPKNPAVSNQPQPDTALEARATFEFENGQYERAIETFRQAYEKYPAIEYRINIANSYRKMGKWPEAKAEYQKLLELDPKHEFSMYAKQFIIEIDKLLLERAETERLKKEQLLLEAKVKENEQYEKKRRKRLRLGLGLGIPASVLTVAGVITLSILLTRSEPPVEMTGPAVITFK